MPKGKLLRNKRKRKTNYPLEKKIQILPLKDANIEDVYSRFNSGSLVVLENGLTKWLVYEVSCHHKIISLASKYFEDITIATFTPGELDSHLDPLIKTEYFLNGNDYNYNKLNEKLQIVNQN